MNKTFLWVAASVMAAIACNGGDTVIAPPPPPSEPAADITGNWTGMFAFRDLGSDCGDSPVTASFEQHAGHVTGFLRTQGGGCTLAGDVAANIVGDVIQGAFTSGYASGTVYGHVSATRVTLQVVPRQDPDSGSSSPGGSTVLSRR